MLKDCCKMVVYKPSWPGNKIGANVLSQISVQYTAQKRLLQTFELCDEELKLSQPSNLSGLCDKVGVWLLTAWWPSPWSRWRTVDGDGFWSLSCWWLLVNIWWNLVMLGQTLMMLGQTMMKFDDVESTFYECWWCLANKWWNLKIVDPNLMFFWFLAKFGELI